MSKRYPGNSITGNPVALSQTSNNGIWDLKDNYTAVGNETWQEADGIYEIPRSLRLRNDGYFSKVPPTTTNRTTWTVSLWTKISQTNATRTLFGAGNSATGGGSGFACGFYNNNRFRFSAGGGVTFNYNSTQNFRDPSAWYHVVVVWDSTNSSSIDRIRVWINNVRITSWAVQTNPSGNTAIDWNNSSATMYVGAENDAGTIVRHEGYITEFHSVDGVGLDPSYFGYADPITGIWHPKKYTGQYGTNGFYLPFNQYTSPIMLGKNSGNPSNLLTYSEQLDNAVWAKPAAAVAPVVTANQIAAPDGTTTADLVTFAGATTHPVLQEVTVPSFTIGDTYTASIYLKTSVAGRYNLQLVYFLTAGGNQDGYCQVTFNSSGVLTSFQPLYTANVSCTAVNVGNGWYRVSVSHKWTTGGAGTTIRMSLGQDSGASSIYAWGAQINLGEGPDVYRQTVATAVNQSWTPNNISTTAGSTYDPMVDSPSNVFTTATDTGGVVSGNYATLNSLIPVYSGATVFSNANLGFTVGSNGGVTDLAIATIPVSSGKWYAECTVTATPSAGTAWIGVCSNVPATARGLYGAAVRSNGYAYKQSTGNKCNGDNNGVAYGATYTTGDIIGIALDLDNRTITFYKNGVSQGVAFTSITSTDGNFVFGVDSDPTAPFNYNFGQRAFAYAPPDGFKSVNTTNIQALGTAAVGTAALQANKWFDINLYPGSGTNRTITNTGNFQSDIVWFKNRSVSQNHHLMDSVRGGGTIYYPNLSNTEDALGGSWADFTSNGFSLGSGAGVNTSGQSYVAWQWKQSPVSGLNIVPYTGTGVARSISHNLGVAPRFMLIKQRDVSTRAWCVYHGGLSDPQQAFYLDSTAAPFSYTLFFNNTAPSSSNFTLGTDASVNQNNSKYIAYLWAEVPGFSKFGNYVGNGSASGPFIYLGFKPKYLLIRSITGARDWLIFDSVRTPYNGYNTSDPFAGAQGLIAGVPYTGASGYSDAIDYTSNGFKYKNAASPNYNGSGEGYVYVAFAESPFALNNRAI